jgi:tRNA threonylcarbamoyladenosine biosynthesis protein TsaB
MDESAVILAVDTTSEFGSVALRRGHATAAEVHMHSTDGFGHVLIQAIEEVLAKANTRLAEIDCFAGASGPGSFTGVRVSLASIKGLAEGLHKPAAAISNLRALSLFGGAALRAVALDARRGQVYGAVYDAGARMVVAETLALWDDWVNTVPAGAEFIGLADGPCEKAGIAFTRVRQGLAAAVAECAEVDGPSGWGDPVGIDANYVRRSDAEMFWKDR